MNAASIAQVLNGRSAGPGRWLVCCPAHEDRNPSLLISEAPNLKDNISVHCFAGCDWKDVKAALARHDLILRFPPTPNAASTATSARRQLEPDADQVQRIENSVKIWDASVTLSGTLGWRYFVKWRGLDVGLLELDHALRWHQGVGAVIALMTDPHTNEPSGIHRTYLNSDGTKRERKMLGRQGVIRLSLDEDVIEGLGIAEGIEDALAILLSGWAPVWIATSAGAIGRFPVLSGIESLSIFSDTDASGMRAAEACAARWTAAGREARIFPAKE